MIKTLLEKSRRNYIAYNKLLMHSILSLESIFNNKVSLRDLEIEIYDRKLLIVVAYVYAIVFGSNEDSMSQGFASVMQQEF